MNKDEQFSFLIGYLPTRFLEIVTFPTTHTPQPPPPPRPPPFTQLHGINLNRSKFHDESSSEIGFGPSTISVENPLHLALMKQTIILDWALWGLFDRNVEK